LPSATRFAADVADDFRAGNLEDLGRAPGIERTREVALEPVGSFGIRPRRDGVREVAYDRVVSPVWQEKLLPPRGPTTWLSPKRLLGSRPRNARRGNGRVPNSFGYQHRRCLALGRTTPSHLHLLLTSLPLPFCAVHVCSHSTMNRLRLLFQHEYGVLAHCLWGCGWSFQCLVGWSRLDSMFERWVPLGTR
jgi:hypothetical protein